MLALHCCFGSGNDKRPGFISYSRPIRHPEWGDIFIYPLLRLRVSLRVCPPFTWPKMPGISLIFI